MFTRRRLSSRTLRYVSDRLHARRREVGTRWRRPPAGRQALLALANLRCGDAYAQLTAEFRIGIATVYRYIREVIDVLAALAPTLTEAMKTIRMKAFVILDSTLLPIDRIPPTPRTTLGTQASRHERPGPHQPVRTSTVGVTRRARVRPRPHRSTDSGDHRRARCG